MLKCDNWASIREYKWSFYGCNVSSMNVFINTKLQHASHMFNIEMDEIT